MLVISLRHGREDSDAAMFPVSLGEIEALALDQGIAVTNVDQRQDALGREHVHWTTVRLKLPDDGAGALPLLRGIILNDDKSSSYKLGLLRAVARVADLTPSLARQVHGEDRVELPLGAVALNWVRLYLPLVAAGLPQMPRNRGPDGLGFAKDGFRALLAEGISAQDLRVGQSFSGSRAVALASAVREAALTIVRMPANFIRYSNSPERVFRGATQRPGPAGSNLTLDASWLAQQGTLTVPGNIWRALQRLGAWVEPVLVAEWARLIKDYAFRMSLEMSPGTVEARLLWQEPSRNTGAANVAIQQMLAAGKPVQCVWSGKPLIGEKIDVDHCLPWSAWPCGDLWNLMPSQRTINQHSKRDRLPSAIALAQAKPLILTWWQEGWLADPVRRQRFSQEVEAALPVLPAASLDEVFTALEWRRLRLRQDQQVAEWEGVSERITTTTVA